MKKHYHISITTRAGDALIPEKALQKDDFLLGVFASNKTKALLQGSGGTPEKKEYVVFGEDDTVRAFADDLISRYIDYRTLCFCGIEKVSKDDFCLSIVEISPSPKVLEQTLRGIMSRSCQGLPIPEFHIPSDMN